MQVHRYDTVIVGAGGAGMRAALARILEACLDFATAAGTRSRNDP